MTSPFLGATSSHWFVAEVTAGVTPANPAWNRIRYTGGLPTLTKDTLQSEELDDSREITDIRTGNESVTGEISVALSAGSYLPLIESALRRSVAAGFTQTGVEITVLASVKTFTRTAGDFVADGVVVGDLIRFSGLTGNNAHAAIVTTVTTTVVTCAGITETLTDEVVTGDYTVAGKYLTGSECKTMSMLTILKGRCGTVERYVLTAGVEVAGFSFETGVNSNVTGSFQLIGRSQTTSATQPTGSTYLDTPTGRLFSGIDGKILVDNAVIGGVTSITVTNDNAASPQFELGDKGVSFVEIGKANNSVSLSAFMEDHTLQDLFINETEIGIHMVLSGPTGAMSFSYPKVFLTEASPEIGGEGSVTQSLSGTAVGNSNQSSVVVQEIAY